MKYYYLTWYRNEQSIGALNLETNMNEDEIRAKYSSFYRDSELDVVAIEFDDYLESLEQNDIWQIDIKDN